MFMLESWWKVGHYCSARLIVDLLVCLVGLECHWAWTFSSSWQISLGFSRPPCSHNLRPNLCAAPWQSAPALLQVTRIINCRLQRVRNRHIFQFVLMSFFQFIPADCRLLLLSSTFLTDGSAYNRPALATGLTTL